MMLLLLFSVQFVPLCSAARLDEGAEALTHAENNLNLAFAVVESNNAGADVSVLLGELDVVSDYLSEADLTFSAGNYERALS